MSSAPALQVVEAETPDVRVSATDSAAIERAAAILQREGVVVLDDLFDPALIARVRDEIAAAYPDMAERNVERNFGPYTGRHTMPLVIEGALADPTLLIAPAVNAIAKQMLGPSYKVDSVGLLVSAPGAPEQERHPDASLFPGTTLDVLLQPFALAYAVPLVPMDATSGRTAFWTRTHRGRKPAEAWDVAETVHPGSAILWDYRVQHCGLANRGTAPRPVLYTALSREWWIEIDPPGGIHYEKLQMARDAYDALRPRLQWRFSRAKLIDTTETSC